MRLNGALIEEAIPRHRTRIGGMDCTFIPKSGKATYGLDWFYNGSANRPEKGLEISVIAVIDVEVHRGYSVSVQQTPAQPGTGKVKAPRQSKRIARAVIEQVKQMLDQLPNKPKSALQPEPVVGEPTRMDHYLEHLKATRPYLPVGLKYLSVDGFYSKKKFIDGVMELDLQVISKLRSDANLRYLYTGVQKTRGARRKYDV